MKVHPVADMFAMMPEDELNELADSIKRNGQRFPIIVKDGVLIDGRNRLEACKRAGVEPKFQELDGEDVLEFIKDTNIDRRNLTPSQRAMAAVVIRAAKNTQAEDVYIAKHGCTREVAKEALTKGGRPKKDKTDNSVISFSTREAAKQANVTQPFIVRAAFVYENEPTAVKAVMTGDVWLSTAYEETKKKITGQNSEANQMAFLRSEAPDLAKLVDEQKMTKSEAKAALDQRKEEARQRAIRAAEILAPIVIALDPRKKTPEAHAGQLVENFDQDLCNEKITALRLNQCALVLGALSEIWKEKENVKSEGN